MILVVGPSKTQAAADRNRDDESGVPSTPDHFPRRCALTDHEHHDSRSGCAIGSSIAMGNGSVTDPV